MSEAVSRGGITILDEHTANRIAAGEVVERPVSVVKELVENAIDAGASQVAVAVEDGGRELIKVTDNGCGMTREDAVLSLQRHATSKIRDADDLERVQTLGFRGEALPSIASVSLIEMVTRHESEQAGVMLVVEAGTITDLKSVGAPQGTTISVRRLFFNTPARLKFLKTAQTELSHITELVGQFAMAYPSIGFRLTHGSRELLSSPATGQAINSVTQVLGKDTARHLVPISFETPMMRVAGYVSDPSLTRINRRDQVFFVNGRPIRSKTITHAVDHAYRGLLQPGRYAVAVVFVDVAPELVDVNVHPTKAEVKFTSEQEVHGAVYRAVNEALMKGAAAPPVSMSPGRPQPPLRLTPDPARHGQGVLAGADQADAAAFAEELARRREEAIAAADGADLFVWEKGTGVPPEESPVPEAEFDAARAVSLSSVSIIGQARGTYILAQCDDGLLIIDQHVAHERVLFDRMHRAQDERGVAVQRLVIPVTLSLSARESTVVSQRLDQLRQAGFELEPFGGTSFVVRGAPASLGPGEVETVLRDTIQELVDLTVAKHLLVRPDQVLITAACKMAVKAGEPLSCEEMERLVEDLLRCDNPFVCPHGRPIIISLSNWELDRKFRRA